jgi:ABC-type proline/glycine betaine transport system substrate-binding protein
MRARHRVFLTVLAAAICVAVSAEPARSAAAPAGTVGPGSVTCPSGTAWDNVLQRCV